MKILRKYALFEFLKMLLISSAALIALFAVIDAVENTGDLMARGLTAAACVRYFALKLPSYLTQVLPVAVLLSSFISMALLNRNNEVTAIKAGGIGIAKIVSPVLVAGFFISIGAIALNENVIPGLQKEITAMETRPKKDGKTYFGARGVWFKAPGAIYNIKEFDFEKNAVRGVTAYLIAPPFSLAGEVYIDAAEWKDKRWVAREAKVKGGKGSQQAHKPADERIGTVLAGLKPPDELTSVGRGYESLDYGGLKRYIRTLERGGYDASKYKAELYAKISFPFVNLVMAFIGIPFALKTGRRAGAAAGVAISLAIGFSFWVVFGVCKALGAEGIVPPQAAVWFPVVLFMAIGAYMFEYVRQ